MSRALILTCYRPPSFVVRKVKGEWASRGASRLDTSPAINSLCCFSWCGHSAGLKNQWKRFDSSRQHQLLYPSDEIGKRVSLKRRILWVRIPSWVPCSHSIMALHILGKDENQVQFLVGAPIFFISSSTKSCCLVSKDGVKSLLLVNDFVSWYGSNLLAISYRSFT